MALNINLSYLSGKTTTLYLVLFPCTQFRKCLHAENHSEHETHFMFPFSQKSQLTLKITNYTSFITISFKIYQLLSESLKPYLCKGHEDDKETEFLKNYFRCLTQQVGRQDLHKGLNQIEIAISSTTFQSIIQSLRPTTKVEYIPNDNCFHNKIAPLDHNAHVINR